MREKASKIRDFWPNQEEIIFPIIFYIYKPSLIRTLLITIRNKIPQQVSFIFSLFSKHNESKLSHLV